MSSTREQLDKLQSAQRRAYAGIVLLCIAITAVIAMTSYLAHVPGETREALGTVVSFETKATDAYVQSLLHVRLDNGAIVQATIDSRAFPKPGRRVRLKAIRMPLVVIERYSFVAFEEQVPGILDKVLR